MSAATTGVTVVAFSGGTGSSACAPGSLDQAAQYPSSSTNVLSVGSTQSTTAGDLASGHLVWNSSPSYAGDRVTVTSLPQPAHQTSLGIAGGRITPDVAFVSSPADLGPIPVCRTGGSCEFTVVGGTSATAPGIAGGLASVLQSLSAKPSVRLGPPCKLTTGSPRTSVPGSMEIAGLHAVLWVEVRRLELLTSALQRQRSTN